MKLCNHFAVAYVVVNSREALLPFKWLFYATTLFCDTFEKNLGLGTDFIISKNDMCIHLVTC